MSVMGMLLVPAPADSADIVVTWLTLLEPQAGSMLNIPEEEKTRLEALIGLLEALGEAGIQSQVSAVRLESTYLMARYAGRFDAVCTAGDGGERWRKRFRLYGFDPVAGGLLSGPGPAGCSMKILETLVDL